MKWITFVLPCLVVSALTGYGKSSPVEHPSRNSPPKFFDAYEERDGRKEAEADLAEGKLRLLGYGMPVHWAAEYREVLRRDYGIESESIAGCVVTGGLVRYAAAYNAVMQPRIIARHGEHVFEDAAAKAVALYAGRHPPKPAS